MSYFVRLRPSARCAVCFFVLCAAVSFCGGAQITERLIASGFRPGRVAGDPIDTLVIHFCSDAVAHPKNPYDLDAVIRLFAPNTSAHYLIDRQGRVYRLVRESDTAWHAGAGRWGKRVNDLNRYSIGIELMGVGAAKEMEMLVRMPEAEYRKIAPADRGFTAAQYVSLTALISEIEARHPDIKHDRRHILGHDEYAVGRKYDPGKLFDWGKLGLPAQPSPP